MQVVLYKIKNFLIYLFLFLLPWQTRLIWRSGELNGGYWEYGTIAIFATEILLWLIFLFYAAEKIYNGKIFNFKFFPQTGIPVCGTIFNQFSIFKNKLVGYLLLVIGYALLIGFFALRPALHFYYLLRVAEGVALFFLIRNVDLKKASIAFILGVLPQALLGIWQFLAQSSFASKWLGLALHDPSTLGTFVVETASGRWLRAYGGLPHPNILGGYFVLAILLLFQVSGFKKIFNFQFSILVLLIILFSSALFFTFSRSAWAALAIVTLLHCYIVKNKKFLILNSLLLMLSFLILGTIFREPALARLQNQNRLELKSQIERVSGYKEAWQVIRHHPIIGVGLGNYTYAVWKEIDSSRLSYAYQPVHNIFVLLLAEVGMIGVLLFAFLFYAFFKNPIIHYFPTLRSGSRLYVGTCFLILFLGFFDHYLLTLYSGTMLLFLISSLIKIPDLSQGLKRLP